MNIINVLNKYDIVIGRGIISSVGQRITDVCKGSRCVIVTDDNVAPLYLDRVENSLRSAGVEAHSFIFGHGEPNKHIGTVTDMLTCFAQHRLTRSDFIVALGGGVTGDLAGFAAAVYLRGIEFVQIPTSLLAQIDSSVGGKTGCDLPAGKNLVGAFHHPSLVLIDPDVLDTLPEIYMRDGMGEMIKYGMIGSKDLFEALEDQPEFYSIDRKITECIRIKAKIVEHDFTEKGERVLLNFGHTVGHAIEKLENFSGMTHGSAVAAGMCIITEAAEKADMCDKGTFDRLKALCEKYSLPTSYGATAEEIAAAAGADKKISGNKLKMVLVKSIGNSYTYSVEYDRLADFLSGHVN